MKAASIDAGDLLEGYCECTEKRMVVAAMFTIVRTPELFRR